MSLWRVLELVVRRRKDISKTGLIGRYLRKEGVIASISSSVRNRTNLWTNVTQQDVDVFVNFGRNSSYVSMNSFHH